MVHSSVGVTNYQFPEQYGPREELVRFLASVGPFVVRALSDDDTELSISTGHLATYRGASIHRSDVKSFPVVANSAASYTATTILLPLDAGAVAVELHVEFSESVPAGTHTDRNRWLCTPTKATAIWMCVGGTLPDLVLRAIEEFFEVGGMGAEVAEDEEPVDTIMTEVIYELGNHLEYVQERLRQTLVKQEAASVRFAHQHKRAEKNYKAHVAQLKTELETQRAVSERQRDRADAAERLRRQQAEGLLLSQTVPVPAGDPQQSQPGGESLQRLHSKLTEQEVLLQQQSEEIDRLRAEAFRWREEATATTPEPTQPENALEESTPSDLRSLSSWTAEHLQGRLVIHPQASRAARKSNFADIPLVYRVLRALATHYWSMRFGADPTSKAAWEAFLRNERLDCSHTGEAVINRRTAGAYHVNWHGVSVPLDMHIQGHSGRDEARVFRVYFFADQERQLILCGHLPSHLPNSKS